MLQFVREAWKEAILLTIWGSFWSSDLMDLVLKSCQIKKPLIH